MRILVHGGGSPLAIREARRFRCSVCDTTAKPKPVRPSAMPKDYAPLSIVGMDVKTLPSWEKNAKGERVHVKVLSILCLGSRYHVAIVMPDESATSWRLKPSTRAARAMRSAS